MILKKWRWPYAKSFMWEKCLFNTHSYDMNWTYKWHKFLLFKNSHESLFIRHIHVRRFQKHSLSWKIWSNTKNENMINYKNENMIFNIGNTEMVSETPIAPRRSPLKFCPWNVLITYLWIFEIISERIIWKIQNHRWWRHNWDLENENYMCRLNVS